MSKTTISIDEEHFVALLSTKRDMQKVDRKLDWDDIIGYMHVEYLKNTCGLTAKHIAEDPEFKYYKEKKPCRLGIKH